MRSVDRAVIVAAGLGASRYRTDRLGDTHDAPGSTDPDRVVG